MKLYKKIYTLYLLSPSCFIFTSLCIEILLFVNFEGILFLSLQPRNYQLKIVDHALPCHASKGRTSPIFHHKNNDDGHWSGYVIPELFVQNTPLVHDKAYISKDTYTIFLDLQLSDFGMVTGILFMTISFWLMTAGH